MFHDTRSRFPRVRVAVLVVLASIGLAATRADGQCQVLQQPVKFDRPPGETLNPADMFTRANSLAIATASSPKRLAVRYNYGFLIYDLTAPAAPRRTQTRSLKFSNTYPKNGDGLERTKGIAMASDGNRLVVPWSDTAGFGTVAETYSGGNFSEGGDFAPEGSSVTKTALARVGSRYIAFSLSGMASTTLTAADITSIPSDYMASSATKLSIPSEAVQGVNFGGIASGIRVVEAPGRTYVIVFSAATVAVIDVSTLGASVPGLTASFASNSRTYTLGDLGVPGAYIRSLSAAAHPADGSLNLLVETTPSSSNTTSTGVSLVKIASGPGAATVVGSYTDSGRTTLGDSLLVPTDSDLVAVFFGLVSGTGLEVHVHSSLEFSRNLAAGLQFTTVQGLQALTGFRSSTGTIYLYFGEGVDGTYAGSLGCETAPAPATASLTVERRLSTGLFESVAPGGPVFVGDTLRIKPAYTPSDSIQPLLEWRLDYDFHDGVLADSSATPMRLSNADAKGVAPVLPGASYLLTGPCDPNGTAGGGGVPATGAGCWASVTSNGTSAGGTPDFDVSGGPPAPGSGKQLTIAFEVQNALNAGGSGLATFNVNWKVPAAVLRSPALLAGGEVAINPQGSPADSGFKWYFASAPVGQTGDSTLALLTACTGPSCNPGLTTPGDYRYWVSVPYAVGFATPDCPGLSADLQSCTGDAGKTVKVTDVVLDFTVPTGGIVGAAALGIQSRSVKSALATPCPSGATGFTYDLCVLSGGACPEGSYAGTGLLAPNPFPSTGTGSLTIPMPAEGAWGLRLKYTYTTNGSCATPSSQTWPATDWAPVTVIKATPKIKLRNASTGADITYQTGFGYSMTTSTTAKAYAYLNGVADPNPPSGMSWTYTNQSGGAAVPFGGTGAIAQGATVPISTVGTYTISLSGYGISANETLDVSSSGGGGSLPTPLSVNSISVSPSSPVQNSTATITCNSSGGTAPLQYSIDYGDGSSAASRSTTHTYTTTGQKTISCSVTDAAQDSGTVTRTVTVVAQSDTGTGTCDVKVSTPSGVVQPYQGEYYVQSGQALTFDALNATGSVSWDFGDGQFGSGSPSNHTYVNSGAAEVLYTLRMTATSCSKSYKVYVSPSAGPDFTVTDAETGAALEWATDAFKARAGQNLKFTPSGTTGAVSWAFGDGTTSTETSPVKAFSPAVDTTYVVTLTNGSATKQVSIKVAGSTGAALTGNYTYAYGDGTQVSRSAVEPNKAIRFVGVDQATTYTWDFGDGTALGSGSPATHTFTRGGAYVVKLTVARTGVPGTATTAIPLTFNVKTPPDPLLWVAGGMAYVDGGNGERFQSDLSIFNPGTQTSTVSLGYVAGASWDGASKVSWITEAIPAGQSKAFANILSSLFRLDKGAWGVVLVRGDDVPVSPVIVSRTYNAARAADEGTFGLSVPAMSVASGVQPQSAAGANFLAGLRHDAAFRTNLTIANLKDDTAEVEVVFRGADGAVLGSPARIIVEARGVKQLNSPLSAAPPSGDGQAGGAGWTTPVSYFSGEVLIKKGSGVYPYATVIDSGTGDSIVVTPSASPSPSYRLPGILRYAQWVSDVSLLNPSAKDRSVRVEYSYVKKGETDRTTKSKSLTLKAFEEKVWIDFFKSILELGPDDTSEYSQSYVDIAPAFDDAAPTEPLVVNGKTYTTSGKGTIGLQVDPYVYGDGIGQQAPRRQVLLSGLQANQAYRTNVALFLTPGATSADAAEVDVHVFDSRGREVQSPIWVRLWADRPVLQLSSDQLFPGLATTDAEPASIVINNPRGAARVGAYATVIDNKSEDATFVAGQPVP